MRYKPDSAGEIVYTDSGYYTVGDQLFYAKFDALVASNKTNKPIEFNFYDDVYRNAHDMGTWRHLTIDSLYSQRARQLRQKYDHVSILFSGGWDSRNIINAFEKENLHIDCIIVSVVPELDNSADFNSVKPDNWYGEIKFHALPFAREYCRRHPGTKLIEAEWIGIAADTFKKDNEEALLNEFKHRPGLSFARYRGIKNNREFLTDLGNKTGCIILGVDKPCIMHHDMKSAQGYFPESMVRLYTSSKKSTKFQENLFTEFFYWTPDLPELAIRGWYDLLKLCKDDELVRRAHAVTTPLETRFDLKMSRYVQDAMKHKLYPKFDPKAWQTDKQREWGFFMTIEEPIVRILDERGIKWRGVFGNLLKELPNLTGESAWIISDQMKDNQALWINDFISDGHTAVDYQSTNGQFINLDMSFIQSP